MDKGFNILERLIQVANIRHRVLASNISNTDTPGYRAKDISFKGFIDEEVTGLATTDPHHIKSASGGSDIEGEMMVETTLSWGDGNNVELDMEMAKMTENALLYEAGIKLLSTKIRMFRNALRGR